VTSRRVGRVTRHRITGSDHAVMCSGSASFLLPWRGSGRERHGSFGEVAALDGDPGRGPRRLHRSHGAPIGQGGGRQPGHHLADGCVPVARKWSLARAMAGSPRWWRAVRSGGWRSRTGRCRRCDRLGGAAQHGRAAVVGCGRPGSAAGRGTARGPEEAEGARGTPWESHRPAGGMVSVDSAMRVGRGQDAHT
jgi:hypothetical protein